jgi:hypothetical protein
MLLTIAPNGKSVNTQRVPSPVHLLALLLRLFRKTQGKSRVDHLLTIKEPVFICLEFTTAHQIALGGVSHAASSLGLFVLDDPTVETAMSWGAIWWSSVLMVSWTSLEGTGGIQEGFDALARQEAAFPAKRSLGRFGGAFPGVS